MSEYFIDTDERLKDIFAEHCNLSPEQYEEIRGELIFLVSDIQEMEPMAEIDKRVDYLKAVFEFLQNTKELTLKEHYELNEMLEQIRTDAEASEE